MVKMQTATEKAIGYAFAENSEEIERQVEQLRKAGCVEIFTDTSAASRLGLESAIAQLKSGDKLMACSMPHLTRSMREWLKIMEQVKGQGADVVPLDDSPNEFFIWSVLAAAQDWKDKTSKN